MVFLALALLCQGGWARLPSDCGASGCCQQMQRVLAWAHEDVHGTSPAQQEPHASPQDADDGVPCQPGAMPCDDGECHCDGRALSALALLMPQVPVAGPPAFEAGPQLQPPAQHVPDGLLRPPHARAA